MRRVALGIVESTLAHAPSPLLLYWLTVDAHTPLQFGSGSVVAAKCGAMRAEDARRLCAWRANAIWWTGRLAQAVRLRPHTRLLIVGDHPPPYELAQFVPDRVPYAFATSRER